MQLRWSELLVFRTFGRAEKRGVIVSLFSYLINVDNSPLSVTILTNVFMLCYYSLYTLSTEKARAFLA